MSDKILKLSQAQTLYQDLRERINALPTDSDIPEVPVQDVQVNGTSIVTDGMANVPVANGSTAGVVKVGSGTTYGVELNSSGILQTTAAGESTIKSGSNGKQVITPNTQHMSTFYGLAKAAGDTTQSQSSNAVGTYTDGAKTAIQSMLDVASKAEVNKKAPAIYKTSTSPITDAIAGMPLKSLTLTIIGDPTDVGTSNVSVTIGTSSTIAEGTTYTKSFDPIYEGTLDFVSGKLTITKAILDLGSIGYNFNTDYNYFYSQALYGIIDTNEPIYSSDLTVRTVEEIQQGTEGVAFGGATYIYVYNNDYIGMTIDEFKAAVAGKCIAYTLRTPQVVELGATALTALNSTMYVQSSDGTVSVEYLVDTKEYIDDKTSTYYVHIYLDMSDGSVTCTESIADISAAYNADKRIVGLAVSGVAGNYDTSSVLSLDFSAQGSNQFLFSTVFGVEMIMTFMFSCYNYNNQDRWSFSYYAPLSAHSSTLVGGMSNFYASNAKITNLADPTANQDAATKKYVDTQVSGVSVPVQDVQVNGTSILSNGVANVPLATAQAKGVIQLGSGFSTNSSGVTNLDFASATQIQVGASQAKCINPYSQHRAVFYGLAKASGDSTQVDSSNPVGTYTDAAKQKIQNMFGITNLLSTEESSTATAAHALNSTFMMDGKLYRATAAIAIGDAVEVGTNCEVVKADEVFVKKTDIATSSKAGIVKIGGGLTIVNGDTIKTSAPSSTKIKTGTDGDAPIVPSRQHESVFYGLSKVAGVDLANETVALGTYPETSKTAIRSLIGAGTPLDVQVNGTSVVSNGVANIPLAGNNPGLVCFNGTFGIVAGNNSVIATNKPSSGEIKNGTNMYKPIVPQLQHESVFYGFAKAAGDTTQSASSNAVGTYTDNAKASIKAMLGITQTLTVTVLTQDNVTVTGQTVTIRAVDATGPIFATAAYEGQSIAFAVPGGFAYYVSVSDTLAHHFNPTTASGVITDTDASVTLQYSDFSTIRTAADIKAALNAGLDLTDLVGEQITCTKNSDTLTWDVANYDATNGRIKLLLHDAFGTANMVFEPAQALMWCENGLAAGSYTFTWNTTQCYFTLTTAIPAGGQLRATNSQFYTYASQEATATLETGTVSTDVIADAIDLGHEGQGLLNHRDRVNYGSNNIAESAIQWWLNSDAAANTPRVPVTKFSRAYSYAQPGFMNGLDANFINCLDEVDWLCSTNNVYECPEELGGYTKGTRQAYTIKSKFCLASEMEIFGSYGGTSDGSTIFDLYNGAEVDDRKKYRGTSAQTWWLRSPSWNYAGHERYVHSSGGAGNSTASTSYAVVPACQISRDSEVTA